MIQHSKTTLGEKDQQAILTPFKKGHLTAGKTRTLFQENLADLLQVKEVRVTSSGTMAFYRILMALRVAAGDEILLPDYICSTLIAPVQALGAQVVVYDNAKDQWLSSVEHILSQITPQTKAIVVNHTFGMPFSEIETLRNKLPASIYIVEDCCHAISPTRLIGNKQTGIHSICSFYSFNATKYLATGEGGAIATNHEDFLRMLDEFNIGDNLSDLNCSLGIAQLKQLPAFIARRQEIAQIYTEKLQDTPYITLPPENSLFFRYPILVTQNTPFWNSKKVAFRKGVDALLSQTLKTKSAPNALNVMEKTVSLPIYPSLTQVEIDEIVNETLNCITS